MINFGRISWLRLSRGHLSMIVVLPRNCWGSSRRIIRSWSKFKRRWRTILKSREQLSHVSISSPMMSFFRSCRKPVIPMQCSLIFENVSIISTESSLLKLKNQEKLSQWHRLSPRPCLKLCVSQPVSFHKALLRTGSWRSKKWWWSHSMILLSKLWMNIPMMIPSTDRNGSLPTMHKPSFWLTKLSGAKGLLRQFWMKNVIPRKELNTLNYSWRKWLIRWLPLWGRIWIYFKGH